MNKQEYDEYLKSEHWKLLKRWKISLCKCKICSICGSKGKVQFHHLRYRKIYDCEPSDLIMICRDCHKTIHKIMDDTTIYFEGICITTEMLRKMRVKKHFNIIKEAVRIYKDSDIESGVIRVADKEEKYKRVRINAIKKKERRREKTKDRKRSRALGTNSRALGTNPRALREKAKAKAKLNHIK